MIPDPLSLLMTALPVALLGGLLGLDMVSFPQIMIARPIVSATVGGAFVGNPAAGLLMGVILELIALETLPFGASRYPEWGSAGVVGGAVCAMQPGSSAGALAVGVFASLTTALLSSWSMVALRNHNGRTAKQMAPLVQGGSARAIESVQLRGLTADYVRGAIVTLVAMLVFIPSSTALVGRWNTGADLSRAFVTAIAATVAAGAVWKIFHTSSRAGWLFLTGLGIGGILLVAA